MSIYTLCIQGRDQYELGQSIPGMPLCLLNPLILYDTHILNPLLCYNPYLLSTGTTSTRYAICHMPIKPSSFMPICLYAYMSICYNYLLNPLILCLYALYALYVYMSICYRCPCPSRCSSILIPIKPTYFMPICLYACML
jgi:hypothetical protein